MGAGKTLMILGALLNLLGTFVFAIYGWPGTVGSGIGFALNINDLIANANAYATALSIDIVLFFILMVIFILFLGSSSAQWFGVGSKVWNRIIGFITSLFPLGVGLWFLGLFYNPDILSVYRQYILAELFFSGEHFGNIFPILLELGNLGLGAYLITGGGLLGVVATFLSRD